MDSQAEIRLMEADRGSLAEQAEEVELVCSWAAEQAMLSDERYMREHGREQPCV